MKIATSHSWSGSESATWLPGWPPPRRKTHPLTSSTTSTAASTFSHGPGRRRAATTSNAVDSAIATSAKTCSGASRSLTLGRHAEPVEPGAIACEPAIENLFDGRQRSQSIRCCRHRPPTAELFQDLVDRGRALEPGAVSIDGPRGAGGCLARDRLAVEGHRPRWWEDQP